MSMFVSLRAALIIGAGAAALSPWAATAQTKTAIEEIVVTAKSRAENLQEVPLSISAFTADALRRASVVDVRDLQSITPSMSIFSGAGRQDPSALAMRGITSNTSDERYQGLSFFIDGVALSGQLISLDLAQVDRVEVIRGPQSATFGRATYTGAVNYITRDPSGDKVSGAVRLRAGYGDGSPDATYSGSGYLSFPVVSDRLWATVEGNVQQTGGYYKDINGESLGRERTKSGAVSALFKPSDDFRVKARFAYSKDHDTPAALTLQQPREWLAAGVPTVVLPRAGGSFWPTIVPDPAFGIVAANDQNITASFPDGGADRDRYFASLVANYDLNGYDLSYRGGYFYSDDNRVSVTVNRATGANQDPVFGPLVASGAVRVAAQTRFVGEEVFANTSHQIMLLSPSTERLRWKVGAYYFWEVDKNWFSSLITATNPRGQVRAFETVKNIAGFAGLDYDVTDQLTLSMEGREANEKVGWGACPTCQNATASATVRSDSAFSPRVTLSYKATPDTMVYALYSRGTKSSRFSYVLVSGAPQLFSAYPEKLDNYEIGTKNTFWDGRAVLNLSAYQENVKGQQLVSTTIVPAGTAVINIVSTNNVGTSRVRGFELEAQAQATERVRFGLGIGFAGQKFTTVDPVALQATTTVTFPGVAGAPVVLNGKTQANVPAWNGNFTAEYSQHAFGDYQIALRADLLYRGKFYGDLANIAAIPAAWKVNTNIRLFSDTLEFVLYTRNLFNNHRATGTGLAGATTACIFTETDTAKYGTSQQCLLTSPSRPREVGLEARWNF